MDLQVKKKFDSYPDRARLKLLRIRELIYEVAENDNIGRLTETLKWGEPSYLVQGGSTIRMDWKSKYPDRIFIYFHCRTKLVETFKEIYQDNLSFNGNRAIVFYLSEELPLKELKHCISMSLQYHRIKHLPLLGA